MSLTPPPLSFSQLTLTINNLPKLQQSGSFLCAFTLMGRTLITNATQTGQDTLTCGTPRTDLLPPIPAGQRECSYPEPLDRVVFTLKPLDDMHECVYSVAARQPGCMICPYITYCSAVSGLPLFAACRSRWV